MIHLSDVKKFERCATFYWRHVHEPIYPKPFVYYNEDLIELVKKRLRITDCFEGKRGDAKEVALAALKEHKVLVNARFVYEDLRIKIPIMIKQAQGYVLYFPYANCYPKESEAQYIKDHLTVLKWLGIPVSAVYVIHLNAAYIREEELCVDALLCINDCLYNAHNRMQHTLDSLLEKCARDLQAVLLAMRHVAALSEQKGERGKNCTRGAKCLYFDRCFQKPQANSILHLVNSAHKGRMEQQGRKTLKEVDLSLLEGNRLQYAQIMADQEGGLFYDRYALSSWLKGSIVYPLSYLDFEWETYAYPPYSGMKPYDVLCFQYSLHIEETKGAPLLHKQFIKEKDCRISFIEKLLADLPKEGSIMVFNMEGAEKLRLKQLAKQYPQYREQLHAVCDRMVDLALPFVSGNFYHIDMEGFYSLKKLVTIFSDFSYEELEISYGLDAVQAWRMLQELDEQTQAVLKEQLYAYCAMDTYAMWIVYHSLLSLVETGCLHKMHIASVNTDA
ncbi:DUF2779 domain-containing protein [Massilicoli timonensis]|uniref:DUF2779 domain-containing protein n=1 Tax=Massilicoli timonensis TaxID=2015901 RepID=UPI000C8219A6|nr:DUF2779 domain-containing protein [Massilicoli timonensis]